MVIRKMYIDQLEKWIGKPMIKVITGIRRSGKSFIMKMTADLLRETGVPEEKIIFLNLELYENQRLHDADELYSHIKNKTKESTFSYIFIDEIQKCVGWERVAASLLAEENYDVYLSGSNASMLSGDLATNIAGRYIEIRVYPLSFREYVEFYSQLRGGKKTMEGLFNEYMKYGGFPGLFTVNEDDEAKRQYLNSLRDTVILRDTVQRHDIRDVDLLARVLSYVMDNIGQSFSPAGVVKYLKSTNLFPSLPTVSSYLDALTDAMIVESARRYDIKGKKIMQRISKYFVCDLGIRHSEIGYRENDISQMLENIVYNELLTRGYEVFVGKEDNLEVDFVASKGEERIYIQVTYLLATNDVFHREYRSLLEIRDAYPKMVLSMDKVPIGSKDGIKHMNIIDFLLER